MTTKTGEAKSKTITLRVDTDTKEKAEVILDEIGINMTTLINACLKALIREQKVPFEMASNDYAFKKMVREKLEESIAAGKNPDNWLTHDEVFGQFREKYGYEV